MAVDTDDPIAELRAKFLAELKAAEIRSRPSMRQMRTWEFLRYCYHHPAAARARADVKPISPSDGEWLNRALAVLDDLDPPQSDKNG